MAEERHSLMYYLVQNVVVQTFRRSHAIRSEHEGSCVACQGNKNHQGGVDEQAAIGGEKIPIWRMTIGRCFFQIDPKRDEIV
jgi:hypothetical protein